MLISILKFSVSFHSAIVDVVEILFVLLMVLVNLCWGEGNQQIDVNANGASPECEVNFIRRLYFQWFNGLNDLGNRTDLNEDNTWRLNDQMKCECLLKDFVAMTRRRRGDRYANVPRTLNKLTYILLLRPFARSLVKTALLRFLLVILFFVGPYILR
jgi:hypothetical protein